MKAWSKKWLVIKSPKKKSNAITNTIPVISEQDDHFFFIAGYTPGGAPYGVIWEEMGLKPWQSLKDIDENLMMKKLMTCRSIKMAES